MKTNWTVKVRTWIGASQHGLAIVSARQPRRKSITAKSFPPRLADFLGMEWHGGVACCDGIKQIQDVANGSVSGSGPTWKIKIELPEAQITPEALPKIEGFTTGDGAHCGLADWYEPKERALLAAIKSRKPFDTGWYASKKEIASARIWSADGKTIHCEASVSDDFDTPGHGSAVVQSRGGKASLVRIQNAIYEAWDEAEADQKSNRPYEGFKVVRNGSWVETYIRNDSELERPPGDNYHKWGWQSESKIPKTVREKLEDFAASYQAGSLTVKGWTMQPWND